MVVSSSDMSSQRKKHSWLSPIGRRCCGGAQHNGGSVVAAARWLRRWRQRDIVTSTAAWRRRGGGGSVAVTQLDVAWRRCGGGTLTTTFDVRDGRGQRPPSLQAPRVTLGGHRPGPCRAVFVKFGIDNKSSSNPFLRK